MPELRHNPLTNEWVIISSERAKRPTDHTPPPAPLRASEAWVADCPFCPGNESGLEVARRALPGETAWRTRTIINKFPALSRDISHPQHRRQGLKHAVDGFGIHEVLIDTPIHHQTPAKLGLAESEAVLLNYRDRYRASRADPRVEHVVIFKNQGQAAGSSLVHPHSQLIATPVVSNQVRDRLRLMEEHVAEFGQCLACRMIDEELTDQVRILRATETSVSLVPYAALSRYHVWIFPRRHMASFGDATDLEIRDLSASLRDVLGRFSLGLGDPDFNYVVRSSPKTCSEKNFHWYISLVPRMGQVAGFELGSGMYINPSLPEESAAFLRNLSLSD